VKWYAGNTTIGVSLSLIRSPRGHRLDATILGLRQVWDRQQRYTPGNFTGHAQRLATRSEQMDGRASAQDGMREESTPIELSDGNTSAECKSATLRGA
jgi:hypothetical protein